MNVDEWSISYLFLMILWKPRFYYSISINVFKVYSWMLIFLLFICRFWHTIPKAISQIANLKMFSLHTVFFLLMNDQILAIGLQFWLAYTYILLICSLNLSLPIFFPGSSTRKRFSILSISDRSKCFLCNWPKDGTCFERLSWLRFETN